MPAHMPVSQSATINWYLPQNNCLHYGVQWLFSLPAQENVPSATLTTHRCEPHCKPNLPWYEKCQTKQGNGRLSC